ncbi:MAG: hypothetical protein R3F44_01415 [Candidatus Competibacteraceae bacterium]
MRFGQPVLKAMTLLMFVSSPIQELGFQQCWAGVELQLFLRKSTGDVLALTFRDKDQNDGARAVANEAIFPPTHGNRLIKVAGLEPSSRFGVRYLPFSTCVCGHSAIRHRLAISLAACEDYYQNHGRDKWNRRLCHESLARLLAVAPGKPASIWLAEPGGRAITAAISKLRRRSGKTR